MKIDYVVGYVGHWAVEKLKHEDGYVCTLSLSNGEYLRHGPFATQYDAAEHCLKQDKGFESFEAFRGAK